MVASRHFTRVDTLELKNLIYQKIGHERAESYFDQLKRFLGFKLSKADFDRSCVRTIGRENIALHNRLIRSIVQNACQAKIPPQKARKVGGPNVRFTNGYQRNCLQSLYGDAFPPSPRKCRSPVNRDRKFRDRPSPLGPLGKSPSLTCEETVSRIQEQSAAELPHSLCGRPPIDVSVEDGEEVEQFAGVPSIPRWGSITAPLGVSFNTHKALHSGFSYQNFAEACQSSGELPDTRTLRSRLEKKLELDGIGVSMDSANVLNHSLDVFLKRLIDRCISVAGSQCADRVTHANMLDFRVAMESNPSILGKDWSTQLEKICHYAS